mmetsp:Transcript_7537/g.16351  ORF Transcript_7537/g.16351 Transcript_7537/m.16351 type:complete len:658 (+) Transcript_7537:255-2228(+)
MDQSSPPPRHNVTPTKPDPPPQNTSHTPSFQRQSSTPYRRRSGAINRSKPPSQERLVLIFITASAIFALISLSPFLLGNFPSDYTDGNGKNRVSAVDWFHRHGDGKGGILEGLAGNKTLLAWHRFVGRRKSLMEGEIQNNNILVDSNKRNYHQDADSLPLARGVSGLPMSQTPALIGAKHGTVTCPSADGSTDIHMDELGYWNDPQGDSDAHFVSPFDVQQPRRYVTFEPDRGGWNNIRMSMEIVIVFAAITGRTLVLPPDTPFYLLKAGESHHGFADFVNLNHPQLRKRMDIITMKEFLAKEGKEDNNGSNNDEKMFTIPSGEEGQKIYKSADYCYYMAKSDRCCDNIYEFLGKIGHIPELQAGRDCLIFDEASMKSTLSTSVSDENLLSALSQSQKQDINKFCDKRVPIFYGNELISAPIIHFHAGEKHHRLLNHFYTFLYFTDTKVDHYVKRFVRDFLHYVDPIFCAAGRVIEMLEAEAIKNGSFRGGEPKYSALHVRRGDFQYKKVKLSADEWYENTKDLFHPGEVIYVATDEKDKAFFEPMKKHYNLHFLNEYSEAAGLDKLDPNYAGMIDTIVASRSRLFVGTWFSTFTGYINRMRGYHGFPGKTSFYASKDRKYNTHKWEDPEKVMTAREWPTGWVGIDGDEIATEEGGL